ncbi:MAG: CinA family protein [Methylorubrum extorquens]|jgi:nicotinamide-nucleotide amidase|uniref:CinA (Competence-damaged protein) family protein n=1 Tax=Methylorubrum extorquens (strain DSM 6343 / CIP 106787 / DM4) TaxID=661410 RepID=C7C8T3_METED|nr:CinA family protein [Methylorubrum extorquens]CAX25224.1 CinA (competence-damaged protein) family protein [Methylorubrum extorquens DM4]
MIEDAALLARAEALVRAYAAAGRRIATAESCTGGLVAGLLTAVPGSSAVVERGFVTYSNEAKAESIGVPMDLIAAHGAVSEPVARAMAEGALAASHADVAVSVTGIAGPGGGSDAKPVGLVHFGLAVKDGPTRHVERRFGDPGRAEIRRLSVVQALMLLEEAVGLRPGTPSDKDL